jgi:hypothetical protein
MLAWAFLLERLLPGTPRTFPGAIHSAIKSDPTVEESRPWFPPANKLD